MKIWANNFLSQHVFPGKYARYVNKRYLQDQYKAIEKSEISEIPYDQEDTVLEQLKKDFDGQIDRKKGLEDKVKAILIGITVSITAMTFSLNYEKLDLAKGMDIGVMLIFLLSVFYFISSAILTVETLVPVGFNSIQTEAALDSVTSTINVKIEEKRAYINRLLKEKLLNDITNLQIANSTYAALKLLRNGIIIFVCYFIAALLANSSGLKKQIHPSVSGKVILKVNDSVNFILPYTTKYNNTYPKVIFSDNFLKQVNSKKDK